MRLAIGVDLGGTYLRVACFAGHADEVRDSERSGPSLASGSIAPISVVRERVGDRDNPHEVVRQIIRLVTSLTNDAHGSLENVAVGIGVAAMLRGVDGFIVRAPQLEWSDVRFGDMVSAGLGVGARVRVVNDVNAVTYGELVLGAGVGAGDLLAVYVGTGVGGGLIANGRLVEGAQGCAGEIGHFKVVSGPEARRCGCGGVGCVEAYAGGRPLERRIHEELSGGAKSLATEIAGEGENVTAADVDRAAAEGDAYATRLWDEVAPLLGTAVANAVALTNPERLILGGGVLTRTPVLRQRVIEVISSVGIPAAVEKLVICESRLGDDAGMAGAALLAERGL